MPQSSGPPVSPSSAATARRSRRTLRFDSRSVAPSGAMSRSWKVKNGTRSRRNSSKATSALARACSIGSPPAHPGPQEGLAAERVAARPDEAVPVADGEAELVLHALAEDHAVGVVPAVGERAARVGRNFGAFDGARARRCRRSRAAVIGTGSWPWSCAGSVAGSARELARPAGRAAPARGGARHGVRRDRAAARSCAGAAAACAAQVVAGGQARRAGRRRGRAELALGDLVQRHVERVGEPLRTRAASASRRRSGRPRAAASRPRRARRCASRERIGDALEHRRGHRRPRRCALSRPTKPPRTRGVVVRRALAAEIRHEPAGAAAACRRRLSASSSASLRPATPAHQREAGRRRQHHAHLVPGARQRVAEGVDGALGRRREAVRS